MKVSSFNIFIENKKYKNWLLFNTKTCSLLEINDDVKNYLDSDFDKMNHRIGDGFLNKEMEDELIECGVLVSENINEIQEAINDDNDSYERIRTKDNFIDLTVCPTLHCNLKCTYCYETYYGDSLNYGIMNQSVQRKVIEAYEKHCIRNSINKNKQKTTDSITWYGGEPMLHMDVIQNIQTEINKLAKNHNRRIRNSITTNGILLNNKNQEILRKVKIRDIQVSIDGPTEIHNKRRYFPKEPSHSFDIITDNLKSLDEYFKVLIRINVDKENCGYLKELVDELVMNGVWPRKNISIEIANIKCQLNGNLEFAIPHTKFAQIETEFRLYKLKIFNQQARDKNARLKMLFPTLIKSGCRTAVNKNANVVGPQGEIYSCWSNVGNKKYVVGSIDDIIEGKDFEKKYEAVINKELRRKIECNTCKILPICSVVCQESYIRDGIAHPQFLCSKWKFIIEESILFNYDFEKTHPELALNNRA